MSRSWKIWITLVVALVAVNLGLATIERLAGGTPGGPPSSSYATSARGLAAYAELLTRRGHAVTRIREPAVEATLDPRATVVLLDADSVTRADRRTLRRFVAAGGRLVAGGADAHWVRGLLTPPPAWSAEPPEFGHVLVPVPELAVARRLASADEGSWSTTGGAVAAFGDDDAALLAVAGVGRGRLLLLADASPLQNRLLDEADNAALGLALAGQGRRVSFLESYHGYARASGLRAIPARWWSAIALAAAAGLLFMLARGRRLGPPEHAKRELPPARREYVESLAAILARTGDRAAALEPLRIRARRLGVDATFGPLRDDAAVVEAGRTLVDLERRAGGGA